jgi:two-component system, sensor histidine kinase YesM
MKMFKSLTGKIILSFCTVIIPLVILLFMINYHSMQTVREQVSESNRELLNLYAEQLSHNLIGTAQYITRISSQDPDIIGFGVYPDESVEYLLTADRVFTKFVNDVDYYAIIESIFVCVPASNRLVLASRNKNEFDDIRSYIEKVYLKNKETELNLPRRGWHITELEGKPALLYTASTNTNVFVGVCINIDEVIKPLDFLNHGDQSGTILISADGKIFTRAGFAEDKLEMMRHSSMEKGDNFLRLTNPEDNKKYLLVGQKLNIMDLKLMFLTPERRLFNKLAVFQKLIYIIPVVLLLLIFIHIWLIRMVLFKPLNGLIKAMKKVGGGDFSIRLKESESGEINFLIQNFNTMTAQIQDLKIDNYERRLEVQELELNRLQSQINPHFYLNTLNILYNLAAIKEYKYIQELSLHLADYFRFITQSNQKFICLKQEINHIINYLSIHKMRYPKGFEYEIKVPELYRDSLIPPLSIQPFVENCIKYGLNSKAIPFIISIELIPSKAEESECYSIIIKDNGPGFSEEMLTALKSEEYLRENAREHIGIRNIFRRLEMNYGSRAALRFSNAVEGGAQVEVVLPVRR